MIDKNMNKEELEKNLRGKGEYVQIDFLTRFVASNPSRLMKSNAYSKLAELYEKKRMFSDVGKMHESLALNSIQSHEKIIHFMKAAESYAKDSSFDRADNALRRAMMEANEPERTRLYVSLKEFYKKQAQAFEKEMKRSQAVKIYEKILNMRISDLEKKEIKQKLLELYEKLGKFKEYTFLDKKKYL